MTEKNRRRFVAQAAAAVAAVGAARPALAQTPAAGRFQPARHAADDWLDRLPGKHRIFIDAVTPNGAGEAVLFANNLYVANQAGYSLGPSDLAIVICMRHFATPFAFSDAFWSKYGKMAGGMLKFNDPKTNQPPTTNVYRSTEYGMALPNLGNSLGDVLEKGTHLAICDMATHFFAGEAAKAAGEPADAVYKEFVASALPNSHFVAAGVVGVNRAQERGYTLIYAG
ncbi:MAG TPA: hypothetical protein VL309_07405 [Vicinamibacterales bacterium]|jgi:hypothetical protein|nr:hypothetical protein [Vicinamibacterales bacterium]